MNKVKPNDKIAIVTVGYNSKEYLPAFFSSIRMSTHRNFVVIFVNNGTLDGSLELIKAHYPQTMIIPLEKNKGPVFAYNIGTQKAVELGCDYVFLVNPDTVLEKGCLEKLNIQANKETILQPLTLIHERGKKTDLINTTGGVLHFLGYSYCSSYRHKQSSIGEEVLDIPVASAVAELIPVAIIKKIGLFDQEFFMYHDDVDFSWRARISGYSVKLVPSAVIWHKYSYGRNMIKLFYFERNRLAFIFKNYQVKTLLLLSPILLVNELFMIVYAVIGGWGRKKIKSYKEIYFWRSQILTERKRIQRLRVTTDKQLYKYLSTQLSFLEVSLPGLSFYSYLLWLYWRVVRVL